MSDPQNDPNPQNQVLEATGKVIEGGGGGGGPRGGGGDPPTNPSKKLTKVEFEHRVTEVYKLLVVGLSKPDIRRFVAEKTTWNVPERTLERYIERATTWFKTLADFHRHAELGKSIARCTDLFSRCHRIQDYKTALAAQKELNALLGLYPNPDLADGNRAPFVALMPASAESDEDWETYCQRDQQRRLEQRRPPKVIGSTSSDGA